MNIRSLLVILLTPVFLFLDLVHSRRSIIKKILWVFLILLLTWIYWVSGYQQMVAVVSRGAFDAGGADQLTQVPVRGTSMMPTIQDGATIDLHNPKKYGLHRGDIVSFQNNETQSLHFLKRIVGLPGETVVVKNGHVSINGQILDEPYVLNKEPTYGNTFLVECEQQVVPADHFLVLGDNRTVSMDSRIVGFVDRKDIEGVLPTHRTDAFLSAAQQQQITTSVIDPMVFLENINQLRKKENKPLLVTHALLNQLSQQQSTIIRDHFDEWKQKSISLNSLLDSAGYKYNKVHEFTTFGYVDEAGVIGQISESPSEKDEFLSERYTEVGIGVQSIVRGDCTFPVITVILSWPAIPTYDTAVVTYWQKESQLTPTILANLQSYTSDPHFVNNPELKQQLRDVITRVADETTISSRIYQKMSTRQWLTASDTQDMQRYQQMVKETNAQMEKLFPNVQGISSDADREHARVL